MTNYEIEKKAHSMVIDSKTVWQDSIAYVTDKVAFNIKNLIAQCRKNYWGVFDKPIDPQTGKKKIWSPLTFTAVEATVKNIDMDTKDINFKARKPERQSLKRVVKNYVYNKLGEQNFDELLDRLERQLAIDGTVIWKVQKDGKNNTYLKNVDRLNFYIDPTAESIDETEAVIERVVMTPSEVKAMRDWENTEGIEGKENIERTGDSISKTTGKMKFVEVYVWEGLAPKHLLTGVDEDDDLIPLRIIISGEDEGGRVHLIEKMEIDKKTGRAKKSYEEVRFTRVEGRWDGVGQAERLIMMQAYQNIILNVRKTRNEVASLGLFKIRNGSGVTPQMLKRLPVNGALKVQNMDDVEQFVVQEATNSSYKDEEVSQTWGERLTSTFEVTTGETMASTTTATVGAIQSRSANTSWVMIKKQIANFLVRVLKRHYIPMIGKQINREDIIRLTLNGKDLIEYDKEVAQIKLQMKMAETPMNEMEQQMFIQNEMQKNSGNDRYVIRDSDIDLFDFDLDIYIENSKIDKNILVTDIINMARMVPQYAPQLFEQAFDILGLDVTPVTEQIPQEQPAQGGGQMTSPANPNNQLTEAMTSGFNV